MPTYGANGKNNLSLQNDESISDAKEEAIKLFKVNVDPDAERNTTK